MAQFQLPREAGPEMAKWAAFSVVLFQESHEEAAFEFWEWFGDGISSRHAEFCVSLLSFMDSDSDRSGYQTVGPASHDPSSIPIPEWIDVHAQDKMDIRSRLASSATSADPALKPPGNDDVFLYATGMAAISAIARALARTSEDSGAVVYGWVTQYEASCARWYADETIGGRTLVPPIACKAVGSRATICTAMGRSKTSIHSSPC